MTFWKQFKRKIIFPCFSVIFLFPIFSSSEELADAVQDVIDAVEKNPVDPVAQRQAGNGYLYLAREVGETPAREVFGAMADFHLDQAVQLDPEDMQALELLGETAVLNKDPIKAASVFEDLVRRQTDPAEGKYLVKLHACYQWMSDPWRGVDFYSSQLQRIPNWPQIKFLKATLLLKIDRQRALEIMWELAGSADTPAGLKQTVRAALKEES